MPLKLSSFVIVCPVVSMKVVADGGMCVGEILSSQATGAGKTVQIWHHGVSDDTRITRVLFNHQEDVVCCRYTCGTRRGRLRTWRNVDRCQQITAATSSEGKSEKKKQTQDYKARKRHVFSDS